MLIKARIFVFIFSQALRNISMFKVSKIKYEHKNFLESNKFGKKNEKYVLDLIGVLWRAKYFTHFMKV